MNRPCAGSVQIRVDPWLIWLDLTLGYGTWSTASRRRPCACYLPIDRDRFGVVQLPGAAVVVLKYDLGMGIGDPALVAELLRHIEDVVDLHDAKVRIEPLQPR